MAAAAQARIRARRPVKQREYPDWTREILPQLKADYTQLPNRIRILMRKLDGLPLKICLQVAWSTYGGRLDERYGLDPVDRDRRRPKWAPIPMADIAAETASTIESAQATVDELVEMGLIVREKLGREAWYALDLKKIDELEDRVPRQVQRKPPAMEASLEEGDRAEAFRRADYSETLAPRFQAKPREIPEIADQVQFVNEGPVPVEVISRVSTDANVWEIRFKAFVENTVVTVPDPTKTAAIPELESGYSYTLSDFAEWLKDIWGRYGFAQRLGVWPSEKITADAYRALQGADLAHFAVVLANYAPNGGNPRKASKFQSVGFLPHVATECAQHKDRWQSGIRQARPVPIVSDRFLEDNPEAKAKYEALVERFGKAKP